MSMFAIRVISQKEKVLWDQFISKAPSGTLFHKYEWLEAAEKHTGYKLIPIVVFKGDVLICVFPVFYLKKGFIKILLSPPNACSIPHLGPVFNIDSQKVYNFEKIYFNVIDQLLDYLASKIGYDYLKIALPPIVNDMRPFIWNIFRVSPEYTYEIPLSYGINEIFNSFDSRIRQQIRSAEKNKSLIIKKENPEIIKSFIKLIAKRYSEQGKEFKISEDYISNLLNGPLVNNIHFLAAYYNSSLISGLVLIEYKNVIQHWLGAISPKERIVGVNELLHWTAIKDFESKGFKSYELIGANTKHLCLNKSKYNPKLINYYVAEKMTMKGNIALNLFNRLR